MTCPWSLAVTSAINRYYDPTTDQFLSIDPKVAQTDQPYVFTNDDPLNSADPLGLSGGPVVFGKPCTKDCGGNPFEGIIKHWRGLAKIAVITVSIVGGAACVMATVGVCGAAAFSIGSVEISGGALAVGAASGAASGASDYGLDSGRHTLSGYFTSAGEGSLKDAVYFGIPEEVLFGGLGRGAHAVDLDFGGALRNLPGYLRSVFK
jgi:hypothetical protein